PQRIQPERERKRIQPQREPERERKYRQRQPSRRVQQQPFLRRQLLGATQQLGPTVERLYRFERAWWRLSGADRGWWRPWRLVVESRQRPRLGQHALEWLQRFPQLQRIRRRRWIPRRRLRRGSRRGGGGAGGGAAPRPVERGAGGP